MFFDRDGSIAVKINNNELQLMSDSWDIEHKGPRTSIMSDDGIAALRIRHWKTDHVYIESINMAFNDIRIVGDVDTLEVIYRDRHAIEFAGSIYDADVCLDVSTVALGGVAWAR